MNAIPVQLIRTFPELGATNLNHVVRFKLELNQPVVVFAPVAGGANAVSDGVIVAPKLLKVYAVPFTGINSAPQILSLVNGIITENGPTNTDVSFPQTACT